MSGLRYRLLRTEDAGAWVALRREMVVDSPWSFIGSPEDDFFADEADIREHLSRPMNAIVGGFARDRLRACAGVRRLERVKCRHRANIWGVYVGPEIRGHGVGRRIMEHAIEAARSWEGVEIVGLAVSAGAVAAQRLYESLGFFAWGVEADAIRIGDEARDEVYMQLDLRV